MHRLCSLLCSYVIGNVTDTLAQGNGSLVREIFFLRNNIAFVSCSI